MNRTETLLAAGKAVTGRAASYGSPENLFGKIALRWTLTLSHRFGWSVSLTPADVALMMIDLKVERLIANEGHADSWVDIAGYAACGGEVTSTDLVSGAVAPQDAPAQQTPHDMSFTPEIEDEIKELAAKFAPVQKGAL